MDDNLFKAILAMDAYNHGYNEGILGLSGVGTKIGNATIFKDSSILLGPDGSTRLDQPASFYAIAYTLPTGEKVISYRGTDELFTPFWSDAPANTSFESCNGLIGNSHDA